MVELDAVDDVDRQPEGVAFLGGDHSGLADVVDGLEMACPITSSSLAASVAMRCRSLWPPICEACSRRESTTTDTARSMPRRTRMGLAPASTERSPSRTMAWASTVAVVVPSPTTPLVFIATSFTSWAPMFANGSRSWISRAMVTPSLVMVGGPVSFSSTALRPLGPRVTLTASARALTPCSSRARASVLYRSSFAMADGPFLLFLCGECGVLRDENRPAAHPPGIEIVEGLLEVLERYRVVCNVTLPWAARVMSSWRSL